MHTVSLSHASELLGIHPEATRELVQEGRLRPVKGARARGTHFRSVDVVRLATEIYRAGGYAAWRKAQRAA